jgi:CubicO group peptidase (beta-lactamase class C family)
LLVQERSGQRFADYLREHVLVPLGMTSADADPATAMKAGAADGYYRWFGMVYRPATVPHPLDHQPSAMVYASAEDLAHELLMNLGEGTVDDTQVLSPRLVRELHRSRADVDGFNGYAAGWYVRPLWESADQAAYDGRAVGLPLVYEHSGSAPTTTTFLGFVPSLHLGVVVLMNSHDPNASSRLYALQSNVWKVLLGKSPTPLGGPSETWLGHQGPVIGTTLVALLLALFLATAREVAAGRRRAAARRWCVLVAALAVDLASMYFVWVYVPRQVVAPVHTIVRISPDIGVLIWVGTAVVVLWAPVRTFLLARPLHGPRHP